MVEGSWLLMAQVLTIILDELPISINAMWMPVIFKGRAAIVKTPEYRAWRQATAWQMKAQRKNEYLSGTYALHVELCAPDKIARDIDNFSFKALSDAAQDAGVIENDSKCVGLKSKWVQSGPAVRAWFIATTGE